MKTEYRIRQALREAEDGMTIAQLSAALSLGKSLVYYHLKHSMPDVYIDRWAPRAGVPSAVWCAVHVPEDCPRP